MNNGPKNIISPVLLDKVVMLGTKTGDITHAQAVLVSVIKNSLLKSGKYSGFCTYSQEQLAWLSSLSVSTVHLNIKKLVKSGWIHVALSRTFPRRARYQLGAAYNKAAEDLETPGFLDDFPNPFGSTEDKAEEAPSESTINAGKDVMHPALLSVARSWPYGPLSLSEDSWVTATGILRVALDRLNALVLEFGDEQVAEKIGILLTLCGTVPADKQQYIPRALSFFSGKTKGGADAAKSLYSDLSVWEKAFSSKAALPNGVVEGMYSVIWNEATTTGLSLQEMSNRTYPLKDGCKEASQTYSVADSLISALYKRQDIKRDFIDIPVLWSLDSEEFKQEILEKLIHKKGM